MRPSTAPGADRAPCSAGPGLEAGAGRPRCRQVSAASAGRGRAPPHRRPRRRVAAPGPHGSSPAPPCGGVPGALPFSHKSGPSPWERAILHRALLTENEKQTGPEINHGAQRLHKGRLCVNRAGRGGQLPAARVPTGLGPRVSVLPGAAGRWVPPRRGPPRSRAAVPRRLLEHRVFGDRAGLACLFVYGH